MQINYLPAGGAVGAGELEVSLVKLYTIQSSAHNRCFFRHYMQDEMKMTSNIFWKQFRFFDFETCRTQRKRCPHPQPFKFP